MIRFAANSRRFFGTHHTHTTSGAGFVMAPNVSLACSTRTFHHTALYHTANALTTSHITAIPQLALAYDYTDSEGGEGGIHPRSASSSPYPPPPAPPTRKTKGAGGGSGGGRHQCPKVC